VHLGDQRASRVEDFQIARIGFTPHGLRHPVRAEDNGGVIGDFVQLVHEYRPLFFKAIHHEFVMHDLVAHIDGRAEKLERALDDVDGAVNAGTKTARIGE
jgi:hypothetical protein